MKKFVFLGALLSIMAVAPLAFGQDDLGKGAQVTEYGEKAFVDELVTGDLALADGTLVTSRRPGKTSKLITIRKHFKPELFKSVENM